MLGLPRWLEEGAVGELLYVRYNPWGRAKHSVCCENRSRSRIHNGGVYRWAAQVPGSVLKKINVRPYSPPAKLKPAAATPPTAILDTPDRAESKFALGGVVGPGSGYEQAVTSYTLVRARVPRGFRARGIFPKKSLSYAAGPLR